MVEIVHNHRVARLSPAIGQLIVHEGTAVFDSQLFCLLLKAPEIASVTLLVDCLIQGC